MPKLRDRVAVVTGASSGLGATLVLAARAAMRSRTPHADVAVMAPARSRSRRRWFVRVEVESLARGMRELLTARRRAAQPA